MATRKTTAAKSAGAKSTTARKTADRADPAADLREAMVKPLKGLAERLAKPECLRHRGRRARKRTQGLGGAGQGQREVLPGAAGRRGAPDRDDAQRDHRMAGRHHLDAGQGPEGRPGQARRAGRAAFQRALDDMRELAELAAKSQADAFDIVRQRISDNVEQVSRLLGKSQK